MVDGAEIMVNDPLRCVCLEDVARIALLCLALIPDPGLLIFRLAYVPERFPRRLHPLRLDALPPFLYLERRQVVIGLRLIDRKDPLGVFHPCDLLRRNVAAQQPVHDLPVLRRQQILPVYPLIGASLFVLLAVQLLHFVIALRCHERLHPSGLRFRVPPCNTQVSHHISYAVFIVLLCRLLVLFGIPSGSALRIAFRKIQPV